MLVVVNIYSPLLVVLLYNLVMANKNKRSFYVNGQMLKKIIEIRNLTQADVYRAANIGENTIYRVIKHNRIENQNDLEKICEILNVTPTLLTSEEYTIIDEDDGHIKHVINADNISEYIDIFEYTKSDNELFTSSYIHQFFNSATGSEILLPDYEKLLFDKILEYRNEFVDYFYTYMTTGKYGKRTYEDFVKSFNKQYDKLLKK